MSYIRCDDCGWSQDDFWSEEYNPISWLKTNYVDELLHGDLGRSLKGDLNMTLRELLIYELKDKANHIRDMVYRTKDEAIAAGWKCPKCGSCLIED